MATEKPANITEGEAGRRFLDALRHSHTKDTKSIKVVTPTAQDDYQIAALGFGLQPTIDPNATNANELKRKRMSLRNTLEELLVEYLGSLSTEDKSQSARYRAKRSLAALADIEQLEQYEEIDPSIDIEVKTAESNSSHAGIRESGTNATKAAEVCAERRRRITQLDRNELSAALQDVPSNQHNIRRHLNYR